MAACRESVLAGVETVEYPGCVPGHIIVYGEKSDAILTNGKGEVLIAAAELGKGRVVVFPHNVFTKSYLKPELPKQNERLLRNIITWISRNESMVTKNVDEIECFDDVPTSNVLVWTGDEKDEAFLQKMLEWIESGGGLVCGICPWGFAQATGILVENMPLTFIMKRLGMAYATVNDYLSTKDKLLVRDNCAECVRLDRAIDLLKADGDLSKVRNTLSNISCIPDEAYQKIKPTLLKLTQDFSCVPTKDNPVSKPNGKLAVTIMCNILIKDGISSVKVIADGTKEFPGHFDKPPKLEATTLTIEGTGYKCVPTGCYLPAGTELELSWTDAAVGSKDAWSVVVGAHRDELFGVDGSWRRWPKVSMKRRLDSSPIKLCSPFGGLIYVETPKNATGTFILTLNNVVPAPRFTYETASIWEKVESTKPGLWCDISGDLITFTMPSESVRKLKDLTSTMKLWDDVVRAHMDLRGCDSSNGRGEWVVTDEQPSAGYMHSGYPIVTHLDVSDPLYEGGNHFLMNGERLKKPHQHGFWGMFHELGHNFQDGSWTWEGTGEVTVNIFTLHAMDVICNVKPWIHPWLADQMTGIGTYLKGGADYEKWKSDPGVALAIYAQQARDFGWDAFKKVFREYNALPNRAKPTNYEEKIKEWIVRFSGVTKRNLCPAFEFWGFSVSDEVKKSVATLPAYIPCDETTKDMAPDRAKSIADKYNIQIK